MVTSPESGRLGPDEIYRAVRDEIIAGVIGSGTFLREEDLAERFGVSRTPVREALRRLETERIVERWQRGRRVPKISLTEALQLYDLRALLEGEAAAQAAESRSASDLVELEELTTRDRRLENSELARLTANLLFHTTVWSAAHNPVLDDVLRGLFARLAGVRGSTLSDERWLETLDEHEALVSAVRERDADEARRIATQQVKRSRQLRLELMGSDPGTHAG
jgi:DNA-binding GntR family transcriptional regulator